MGRTLKFGGWFNFVNAGFTADGLRGLQVVQFPYGWAVGDATGEWQIVLTLTGRQDGKTAWCVQLVSVDGDVQVRQGLNGSRDVEAFINKAIGELTEEAGWISPLNVEDRVRVLA